MRRIKKFIVVLVMLLSVSVFMTEEAFAKPLDEIQDYTIKIAMRSDGTMDITYHVEWKVLESESEGPLEWVKIGIPNKHVDEIKPNALCIRKIGYMYDSGTYVRIDLDRKYKAGETVKLDFSIHQSYMYVIDDDEHLCRYSFTPGWFDDADVKHIKIMWKDDNVIESSAMREDDGYLIWESSLKAGERLNASVEYNLDVFTTNKDEQFEDGHAGLSFGWKVFIAIIIIVVIVVVIWAFICDDNYYSGSGFGGGRSYHSHYVYHSSSHRSSCACASHCACACACAGGGRAGCSVKDFYKMKEGDSGQIEDETDTLLRVLREEANK